MTQANHIQQHFAKVESQIDHLMRICQSEDNVPQEFKDCVEKLNQQKEQARRVVATMDEDSIRQCIDHMEQTSDRAKHTIERSQIDTKLRAAVDQTHTELSTLKHQLH